MLSEMVVRLLMDISAQSQYSCVTESLCLLVYGCILTIRDTVKNSHSILLPVKSYHQGITS